MKIVLGIVPTEVKVLKSSLKQYGKQRKSSYIKRVTKDMINLIENQERAQKAEEVIDHD